MNTQMSGTGSSGVAPAGAGVTNGITVLVSTAIHPSSGRSCTSRNDTLALETARQLSGGALRTLHVGDPQDAALPDYLALGASCVQVLPAAPGDDTVKTLADQVREAKLILCGTRAQSGEASGMLPYLLAAALERPILADALEIQLAGDSAKVIQFLPKGRRRTVTVSLPAIITVHPLAPVTPRYAYARRVTGRIETLRNSELDVSAPAHPTPSMASPAAAPRSSSWTLESAERVPVKLKAPDRRSGHARMLAATAAASRGGQVVSEGSHVEKAQVVLAYLREHGLIAF